MLTDLVNADWPQFVSHPNYTKSTLIMSQNTPTSPHMHTIPDVMQMNKATTYPQSVKCQVLLSQQLYLWLTMPTVRLRFSPFTQRQFSRHKLKHDTQHFQRGKTQTWWLYVMGSLQKQADEDLYREPIIVGVRIVKLIPILVFMFYF